MNSARGLEPVLRETALIVLRRHHMGDDDVRLEENEPQEPPSCVIRGHRVSITVDAGSAAFKARAGRWSGRRADYPTDGAFVAAFEDALHAALAG
jgi:hypothetical protein